MEHLAKTTAVITPAELAQQHYQNCPCCHSPFVSLSSLFFFGGGSLAVKYSSWKAATQTQQAASSQMLYFHPPTTRGCWQSELGFSWCSACVTLPVGEACITLDLHFRQLILLWIQLEAWDVADRFRPKKVTVGRYVSVRSACVANQQLMKASSRLGSLHRLPSNRSNTPQ